MYWRPYNLPEPPQASSSKKKRSIVPPALGALVLSAISVFFFWAFYQSFYRWEFNELGRYYDSETKSVYTTGGMIWIVPAIIFLVPALMLVVVTLRRIWQRRRLLKMPVTPNNALLTDASTSPLRAQCGAAKRER